MKHSPLSKGFRNLLGLLTAFALAGAVAQTQTDGTHLVPNPSPIPASFFGIHMFRANTSTPWPTVPVSAWRLWDTHTAWPDIEGHQGQFKFTNLDSYLTLARAHNVPILLTLGLSPQWASARPQEASSYQPGYAAEPRLVTDWDDYVRAVVTHCKGQVPAYEMWNEPNYKQYYTGRPDQLLTLTQRAHDIIKAVDPSAIIVSPSGTGGMDGVKYLDNFLQAGGGQYVDVIGFHFYADTPEKMVPLILAVKAVMARNKVGSLPLWDTEAGWIKPKTFPSEEWAPAYLSRAFILNWAAGVQRFYWYAWEARGVLIETTTPDNATLTPAGQAYGTTFKWLVGAQLKSCDASADQTWVCSLHRSGLNQWIVWNPDHNVTFNIPASWHATSVTPLLDKQSKLNGSTLNVSQVPQLVSSAQ